MTNFGNLNIDNCCEEICIGIDMIDVIGAIDVKSTSRRSDLNCLAEPACVP